MRPSPDQMLQAAEWLVEYEGPESDDDVVSCQRVAAWLRQQAEDTVLRDECRKTGVSVKAARAALAKRAHHE